MNMRDDPKEDVFLEDDQQKRLIDSTEEDDKFLSQVKTIKLSEKSVNKDIENEQFLFEYLQNELYKPNKSANLEYNILNTGESNEIIPMDEGLLKTYQK